MVVGWDAADWKVIIPLVQQGKMPAMKKLMENGVWGKLSTIDPPLSPMLWTSIATGKRADKHGILGFIEPKPDLSGVRPVTSTSRKVKAIWNILNQQGMKSNVVAWWPSNPVEPINGCMTSNFYQVATKAINEEWPMVPGTVHPERIVDAMKECRIHPVELTSHHIKPFLPLLDEMDHTDEIHKKRIATVAKMVAEAATTHAASTWMQSNEAWDFMAVYHDMIDHFSHFAMKFHPPRLKGIPEDLFEKYKDCVNGAYIFQDMMLERTLELCDEDTTVMVVSDHGFHSDHLRMLHLPKEPASPAREHSPYGIFCLSGPGVKKGERIFGASILDITPTLLHLYGLPVGADMEGKVLVQCFEEENNPDFIPSWEDVKEGDPGMHPEEQKEDPWASKEAMEQLVQLGYVEAPEASVEETITRITNESKYYLARNIINAGRFNEAIPILSEIFEASKQPRFGQRLAYSLLRTRRYQECREVINRIREILKDNKENERFLKETSEEERKRWIDPDLEMPNYLDLIEGMLYLSIHRPVKAIDKFITLTENNPNSAEAFYHLGRAYMTKQKWEKAEKAFITSLAIDDEHYRAFHGLGHAYLRLGRYDESVEMLLNSIELNYSFPNAHYHLGEALSKSGKFQEAANAFEVACTLQPGMTKAHKWLVNLYSEKLNNPVRAKYHQEFMDKQIKGEVIIVSGLPRSGTSMMMQMLHAGGVETLNDQLRTPDDNNPKGYFEFDPVKRLATDQSWLPQAKGKAVKIIAQLLVHLPQDFNYKIVFMDRDINEVLVSQQKMLGKLNQVNAKAFPTGLYDTFQKQLAKMDAWVASQPNVNMLKLKYADVVANPEEAAESISSFLGMELDINKMVLACDAKLYRNKLDKV